MASPLHVGTGRRHHNGTHSRDASTGTCSRSIHLSPIAATVARATPLFQRLRNPYFIRDDARRLLRRSAGSTPGRARRAHTPWRPRVPRTSRLRSISRDVIGCGSWSRVAGTAISARRTRRTRFWCGRATCTTSSCTMRSSRRAASPRSIADDRTGASPNDVYWSGDAGQSGQYLHGYTSTWLPAACSTSATRACWSTRCSLRPGIGPSVFTSTRASQARRRT